MFSSYVWYNFKTDTISMYKFYLWETGKHFRKVNFPLSTDTLRGFYFSRQENLNYQALLVSLSEETNNFFIVSLL